MNLLNAEIITDRLKLKSISELYIEDIFLSFTEAITTYMFPQPSGNIEDTKTFVKNARGGLENGTNLQLVILNRQSNEFLGCCGLHNLDRSEPEIGIWIKKDAHGNGFGLEAVAGIFEWSKQHLKCRHLKYPVDRQNKSSRKIPEYFNGKVVKAYKLNNMLGRELDLLEYWIDLA